MNKFFSANYSKAAHHLATLILRLCLGLVMVIGHGWVKVTHFTEMQDQFVNFLSMGSHTSLVLSIVAEFICSILIIFGLFTRLAAILLIINMLTALTLAHSWEIIAQGQLPFVFLAGWIALLLLGPGKISLDAVINKR